MAELYQERARVSALAASCDEMAAEVLINAQRAQSAIKDEFSNAIATNQGSSGFSASQETAVTQMMAKIQAALSNPNASAASLASLIRACDNLVATKESVEMKNDGAKALTNGVMRSLAEAKGHQLPDPNPVHEQLMSNQAAAAAETPPEAPVALEAQCSGGTSLKLAWVPPSSVGAIEKYEIRQLEDKEWRLIHKCDHSCTTHTVTGLAASTRYCFGVRGVSKYGPGPWKGCTVTTAAPMYYSPLPTDLQGNSSDFGHEGLLYWIGTQEGTGREWRNPAITGDVILNVSSKDGGTLSNALARYPSPYS